MIRVQQPFCGAVVAFLNDMCKIKLTIDTHDKVGGRLGIVHDTLIDVVVRLRFGAKDQLTLISGGNRSRHARGPGHFVSVIAEGRWLCRRIGQSIDNDVSGIGFRCPIG